MLLRLNTLTMSGNRRRFFSLSNRQKRRIIDLEITNELSSEPCCSSNLASNKLISSQIESENISPSENCECVINEQATSSLEDVLTLTENAVTDDSENESIMSTLLDLSDEINIEIEPLIYDTKSESLSDLLRKWAIKFNIQKVALTDLLNILRKNGHSSLPSDSRTLMKTPVKTISKLDLGNGGQSMYFGIKDNIFRSIRKYYTKVPDIIKLNFNVDGLPLHKSSNSQFWPIMCSVLEEKVYTEPFIVKIFHGCRKPDDVNIFLEDFVNELKEISENGIVYLDKKINVIINAFICDAPAKAYILGVKNHTGYYGCNKCVQEGDFIENRVVFPELDSAIRTDLSFRNREQPEYHHISSILENLNIDMVTQFPLDYMHLVCLGVMKKLITFWIRGKMNIPANIKASAVRRQIVVTSGK